MYKPSPLCEYSNFLLYLSRFFFQSHKWLLCRDWFYLTGVLHYCSTPIHYIDDMHFNPKSVWNFICSVEASLISQNEINFFIAGISVVSAKKSPTLVHSYSIFLFLKKYLDLPSLQFCQRHSLPIRSDLRTIL